MSSETSPGVHTRVCDRCGEEFHGLSAHVAQKRLSEHHEDCRIRPEEHPDDVRVNMNIKPPRQLDQYSYTEHFGSMLTRRENPDPSGDIVELCIKRGVIKSTHKPRNVIFEWYDEDNWQWWVVAKMLPEACRKADKNHLLLTIYAKNSDAHEEVEKYD
jgi:hypothetical protein